MNDERDLDAIADRVPKESAALIFGPSGVDMLIPNPGEGDELVPMHVLAATELTIRFAEGDLSVQELADAFMARVPE